MTKIRPWTTLSEQSLVDDRWITLVAERCATVDGKTIDPYYVVRCRDWAAVVAVTPNDELVLVRQYRQAIRKVTLELPAGEIDPPESAICAGLRELREEAGFDAVSARCIRTFSPNPARFSNTLHAIYAEGVVYAPNAMHIDPTEETEVVLWPMREIAALFFSEEFCNSTQVAVLAAVLLDRGQLRQPD